MSNNDLLVFLVIASPVNTLIYNTLPNSPGSEKQDFIFHFIERSEAFQLQLNCSRFA